MKINKKAFENIKNLKPFDRYKFFIKRIADYQELWTIINKSKKLALAHVDDNTMVSFWPMKDFIKDNLDGNWKDCKPLKIDLDYLEEKVIPLILENNYLINIFPIDGKSGFVVNIDEFVRDLNEELEKY